MTNGTGNLLRKGWDSLMAWVMAMDYPAFDYTNDRIRGLEHEVKELREELRRTRISSETATVGSSGMTPLRRAPGGSQ